MPRRPTRASLFSAAAFILAAATPSIASSQIYTFNSCASSGVCGWVQAFFAGSLLEVRVANNDNTFGSALFTAQLFFASALDAGNPSIAFSSSSTASTGGTVSSIGTTLPWVFNGVGGSTELDITSFDNSDIEGTAASTFRASSGDLNDGTWETSGGGYVQFEADLSGVPGVNNGLIVGLGFCTDQDCVSGPAVVTPEPASVLLLATGLAGMAAVRRRRRTGLI